MEYLGPQSLLTFYDKASGAFPENQGPYFAKDGEVWVMGETTANNSHDSRMWFGGQGGGVPSSRTFAAGRSSCALSVSGQRSRLVTRGRASDGQAQAPSERERVLIPSFEQCLRNL